eukprot:CAMPEP_0174731104 /NCGR_PEP_ID=MMETSP1094-20130205/56903_1 /TAXON_ID=156173 /ORGANISM="Chrysochromulina brevifilum, Strain UTEX LB 985" /LENGTH=51 /DNA_ID=CAMNT_0015933451 /DNA_START=792 /DNA_END=944 /DNA_ORIENTATION=+
MGGACGKDAKLAAGDSFDRDEARGVVCCEMMEVRNERVRGLKAFDSEGRVI